MKVENYKTKQDEVEEKTNNEKAIPFGPFLLIAFTFIYFTKMSSLDVLKFLGF